MKLKPLLALSAILNVGLVIVVATLTLRRPARPEKENDAAPGASSQTAPALPAESKTSAASAPAETKPAQQFDWHMVESDDYRKYIANLRAIGCPEETIRDIIIADVNKLFESRRKEMNAGGKKFEFWKAGNPLAGMMDSERLEKQQKLAQEKRALLKELLGVEPEEKFNLFAAFNPFETMLDFLSTEKQNKVMQMFQDLQVKMAKQFKDGMPDAEDMKGVQKAQKEMEAEMAKILTPQELEDYQLRMSQTAMTMRMQLASFDPNEQEFRQIFAAKKKFDDEFGALGQEPTEKAEQEKKKAAKKELDDQLKNTLGETRFAEYERAQDWNFQQLYRITERNGVPKDSAIKVYDMKKMAEDEASKLRADKALSSEQRTAALQGIRAETEGSMRTVLGEKAYTAYEKQAYWLNTISPKAKEPSP